MIPTHPPAPHTACNPPIGPEAFCKLATAPTTVRSFLFLRHAERPPIQLDDPTFGQSLSITPAGDEMARALGARLAPLASDCIFRTSPLQRTRDTAIALAKGMGITAAPPILDAPEIGLQGLWITDLPRVHQQYEALGSEVATDHFLKSEHLEGYQSVPLGTALTLNWISGLPSTPRHTLLITHDIFLAALLNGLGVGSFHSKRWVGFLQGLALIESDSHQLTAYYCVPDPTHYLSTFFQ